MIFEKYCVVAAGKLSCGWKFANQHMYVVGFTLLFCLGFIGWCFYDWYKHPENWE